MTRRTRRSSMRRPNSILNEEDCLTTLSAAIAGYRIHTSGRSLLVLSFEWEEPPMSQINGKPMPGTAARRRRIQHGGPRSCTEGSMLRRQCGAKPMMRSFQPLHEQGSPPLRGSVALRGSVFIDFQTHPRTRSIPRTSGRRLTPSWPGSRNCVNAIDSAIAAEGVFRAVVA